MYFAIIRAELALIGALCGMYLSRSPPPQIAKFMGPTWAHLGAVGPKWAPLWPHKPCYQGSFIQMQSSSFMV